MAETIASEIPKKLAQSSGVSEPKCILISENKQGLTMKTIKSIKFK